MAVKHNEVAPGQVMCGSHKTVVKILLPRLPPSHPQMENHTLFFFQRKKVFFFIRILFRLGSILVFGDLIRDDVVGPTKTIQILGVETCKCGKRYRQSNAFQKNIIVTSFPIQIPLMAIFLWFTGQFSFPIGYLWVN